MDISDNGEKVLVCCGDEERWLLMFCCSGLDTDLTTLLVWLAKNRSIRHLSLGKNFNNIKSKWVLLLVLEMLEILQTAAAPSEPV